MPLRLTSTTSRHCSGVQSRKEPGGLPRPALLNSRSTRPKRCTVRAKSCSTAAGSLTSVDREEHTSELQSHLNLVCRLLLEKKKKNNHLQAKTSTVSHI